MIIKKKGGIVTWCFTPSQPVRLYQGERGKKEVEEEGGGGIQRWGMWGEKEKEQKPTDINPFTAMLAAQSLRKGPICQI